MMFSSAYSEIGSPRDRVLSAAHEKISPFAQQTSNMPWALAVWGPWALGPLGALGLALTHEELRSPSVCLFGTYLCLLGCLFGPYPSQLMEFLKTQIMPNTK